MKRRSRGEGSIYYLDSKGLWVAKITLPDGSRRVKYNKTQKVVRDWLTLTKNEIRQGMLPKDEMITVAEFLKNYMDTVGKHNLRPKTIETYDSLLRLHILPSLGRIKLVQLRPDHLQTLYSNKLDSGLSKRTVQFIHSILHRALDQAFRWGFVFRNVADLVKAPTPTRAKFTALTPDQVHTFLDSVRGHRFYLIYVLAIYGSFREGEILAIHKEDCDTKKGTISVKYSLSTQKGGLKITEPKTEKSRRTVILPKTALDALKHHLKHVDSGLIFTTSTGKPISPRNLVRHFKGAIRKAGLPDMRFYDLRHTSASLLLAAGTNPKLVQERLGHSQISLTLDTYSHVLPGLQEKVAEDMERILGHP